VDCPGAKGNGAYSGGVDPVLDRCCAVVARPMGSGTKAVEGIATRSDYDATRFHLFGLDPSKFVLPRPIGASSPVDGQPARVVKELLS
jgi:hypothetical protein